MSRSATERPAYEDDEGNSYYVVDVERERLVFGPFGSRDYARKVQARALSPSASETWPWPEDLRIGCAERTSSKTKGSSAGGT